MAKDSGKKTNVNILSTKKLAKNKIKLEDAIGLNRKRPEKDSQINDECAS